MPPSGIFDLSDSHDVHHLQEGLKFVEKRRLAIDVGAHRGIWTKILCDEFDEVWAFEPVPLLAEKIDSRARVFRMALGGMNLEEVMIRPGHQNTGQGYVVPVKQGVDWPRTSIQALDTFTPLTVDFLKIDVEGYELFVLQGALGTINRCKPVIMLEENGLCTRYAIKPGAVEAFMHGVGYRPVAQYNKDIVFVPDLPQSDRDRVAGG